MVYRLPLDDVRDGLASAAGGQVQRLRKAANRDDPTFQQRRALKKLRALLQLAVTSRTHTDIRRLDRLLRDAGRQLSGGRDRAVLAVTLDRLVAEGDVSPVLDRTLRGALATHGGVTSDGGAPHYDMVIAPALAIDEIATSIAALRLRRVTAATVIDAAADGYHAARRGLKQAVAAGSSEAFHDWRKLVQRHARQMQLLVDLWPADMCVRATAAKDLARVLGEEHDLHGFGVWLATVAVSKSQTKAMATLARTLERRQRKLRAAAASLGQRSFVERPKAFHRRLNVYTRHAPLLESDAPKHGALVAPNRLGYDAARVDDAR